MKPIFKKGKEYFILVEYVDWEGPPNGMRIGKEKRISLQFNPSNNFNLSEMRKSLSIILEADDSLQIIDYREVK